MRFVVKTWHLKNVIEQRWCFAQLSVAVALRTLVNDQINWAIDLSTMQTEMGALHSNKPLLPMSGICKWYIRAADGLIRILSKLHCVYNCVSVNCIQNINESWSCPVGHPQNGRLAVWFQAPAVCMSKFPRAVFSISSFIFPFQVSFTKNILPFICTVTNILLTDKA